MNFGQNYEYATQLLNLAKELVAIDGRLMDRGDRLPDAVHELAVQARILVTKMDN